MSLNAANLRDYILTKVQQRTLEEEQTPIDHPEFSVAPGTTTYAFVDAVSIYFVQFFVKMSKDMVPGAGPPPSPKNHKHTFTGKSILELLSQFVEAVNNTLDDTELFKPTDDWTKLVLSLCTELVNQFDSGKSKTDLRDGAYKHTHVWTSLPITPTIVAAVLDNFSSTISPGFGRAPVVVEALIEGIVETVQDHSEFSYEGTVVHTHTLS